MTSGGKAEISQTRLNTGLFSDLYREELLEEAPEDQEAPGGLRGFKRPQEVTGGSRKPQKAPGLPGGARRTQEAEAPGGARRAGPRKRQEG